MPVRLHFAINSGDIAAVQALIKQDVDMSYVIHGQTPLTLAIFKEHIDIAKALIKGGADVRCAEKTSWQRKPIHMAAAQGYIDLVTDLLTAGEEVNTRDSTLMTALHWAAFNGQVKVVQCLVAMGADMNAEDDAGRTALHRATERNHLDVVHVLFSAGAIVNKTDHYGWSALFLATACNNLKMVQELLTLGADLNIIDNNGETVLHIAAGRLRGQILLVLCRSDINIYTRHLKVANEAVHQALQNQGNELAVAMLLVDFGIDINVRNRRQQTALEVAAVEGQIEIIRLLIKAGANLSKESWIVDRKIPSKLAVYEDFCHWLCEKAVPGVHSLAFSCQLVIRQCLSFCISEKVDALPLPRGIKMNLMLQ